MQVQVRLGDRVEEFTRICERHRFSYSDQDARKRHSGQSC
jgi:hypothetical protein